MIIYIELETISNLKVILRLALKISNDYEDFQML